MICLQAEGPVRVESPEGIPTVVPPGSLSSSDPNAFTHINHVVSECLLAVQPRCIRMPPGLIAHRDGIAFRHLNVDAFVHVDYPSFEMPSGISILCFSAGLNVNHYLLYEFALIKFYIHTTLARSYLTDLSIPKHTEHHNRKQNKCTKQADSTATSTERAMNDPPE